MEKNAKINVAGHRGMVDSAIVRKLKAGGYQHIITRERDALNLTRQEQVEHFFAQEKPDFVFLDAAKVGGIWANSTARADFICSNLGIETHVIHSAYLNQVCKLLFLGSSCIYRKHCLQPMKEGYFLSGYLESTNEPYAVAKIAGIKMCESYNRQYGTNYINAMPTNLYGHNDNFDLVTSHVLPAVLRKFDEIKFQNRPKVTEWGIGKARREFLYVDDLADACLFLMDHYRGDEIVNIGVGDDITIRGLAMSIGQVVGFKGRLSFDSSKPNGTLQKLLDVSKMNTLGWKAKAGLKEGIAKTYQWYLEHGVHG